MTNNTKWGYPTAIAAVNAGIGGAALYYYGNDAGNVVLAFQNIALAVVTGACAAQRGLNAIRPVATSTSQDHPIRHCD